MTTVRLLRLPLTWLGTRSQRPRIEGWDRLSNGELLTAGERAGFDMLLTADNSIRYQQNLSGRRIVNAATPGSYAEVEIPFVN